MSIHKIFLTPLSEKHRGFAFIEFELAEVSYFVIMNDFDTQSFFLTMSMRLNFLIQFPLYIDIVLGMIHSEVYVYLFQDAAAAIDNMVCPSLLKN